MMGETDKRDMPQTLQARDLIPQALGIVTSVISCSSPDLPHHLWEAEQIGQSSLRPRPGCAP